MRIVDSSLSARRGFERRVIGLYPQYFAGRQRECDRPNGNDNYIERFSQGAKDL
ncbi:MAG: hypothetical protein GDA56_16980 [Hormoscilla sp. GM7CHS1pb]|nr:hypothetical protein [Hormoscilla sp. GM7CHS1pb]